MVSDRISDSAVGSGSPSDIDERFFDSNDNSMDSGGANSFVGNSNML